MLPTALPRPTGCNPLHFLAMTGLLALLAAAYIVHVASGWIALASAGDTRTSSPYPLALQVGEHRFLVPANMVPRAEQRNPDLQQDRLVLEMTWPALAGYAGGTPDAETLITLDLIASRQVETLGERLDSVYRRLAGAHEFRGPAGLSLIDMSGRAGAGNDVIVFEASERDGFIARCQTPEQGVARCFRDFRLAPDLVVSYRFQRSALANWGRMDRRIIDRISAMRLD
ncbi:hypothetical protein GWI72_03185 [Microvirga tunisiensis]|uniref:Uncharacterized protein n=2 Tax=Pannonibacter tanglangensis TaxID=2750084 RepID=A0ABW9ZFK6_9HYPH|nr:MULTISPECIES: hypothetical protein [unclassified Pannonibacter]NBN63635.1 hypothetical protein [Pannonibacter sp. XCT-34]NBN77269.1 hypothetical protein [Pannonibacter sp. XCT-53]